MRFGLLLLWGVVAVPIGGAATLSESFSGDPAANGWKIFGDPALFQWDDTNGNLRVTWDSSRTNTYFYHPLPTLLAKDDDFGLAFDLRLDDVATGVDPNKPSTFQIAVALLNLNNAMRTNFYRGAGANATHGARSTVEFDYFPESEDDIAPTISPILISSNNQFAYSDTFPVELTVTDLFHIELNYTASNRTLATVITRNGQPFDPIDSNQLSAGFTDFRLDAIAVCSYSDVGQFPPQFAGSLLVHGVIDNIVVTLPPPPIDNLAGAFSNTVWQVRFTGRTNWVYTLEQTMDLHSWTAVSPATAGLIGTLVLSDSNAPVDKAFYRVRASRP